MLQEEFVVPLGITQNELAERLGISRDMAHVQEWVGQARIDTTWVLTDGKLGLRIALHIGSGTRVFPIDIKL
jgi:predicted DNA-binding protein (UPF0251 family)